MQMGEQMGEDNKQYQHVLNMVKMHDLPVQVKPFGSGYQVEFPDDSKANIHNVERLEVYIMGMIDFRDASLAVETR